ncbi:hypothetical protein CAPTEDRAFT_225493 [Capitella teleta]|uniref:D-serine dehydratase-like domain-containing protein n=1 Tax=Capitella teleta TaxID=283909 RepID=R7T9A4_CAPTE|nr:hypothetical protein CAPTEDRAFT_225493 [Capitella teleta]|eukprot:ELT90023.1 hypothetical protein CAPTEDRAFT_225493 [Capitella teleta]
MSFWRPPPPCQAGDSIPSIDTPALIVDMAKIDKNLALMPKYMEPFSAVTYRPHAKAHKCPDLAKLQLIGKPKLRRFAALSKEGKMSICVDNPSNIREISEVAVESGVNIDCVVEVNVGQDRCGVEPGGAAVDLAKLIIELPGVAFKGIQPYNGWNQHIRTVKDRKAATDKVVSLVQQTLKAFEEAGVPCPYVTGGGTGTFPFEAGSGIYTEVQPGSYLLMDADYGRNLDASGKFTRDFEQSLYVLTTVMSVTKDDRAVVDAGMKGVSLDSGPPLVSGIDSIEYHCGGDEHGILKAKSPEGVQEINKLKVGDLLWLIPGHCDPTVNLHDWFVALRDKQTPALTWDDSHRHNNNKTLHYTEMDRGLIVKKLRSLKPLLHTRLFRSFVIFTITLISYLCGYASEYWNKRLDSNYGLWRSCSGGSCHQTVGFRASDWLRAVQTMCSFGLISAIVGGIAFIVWICMRYSSLAEIQYSHVLAWKLSRWFTTAGSILAGFFGLIGVIVYGDKYHALVTAEAASAPQGWGYWFMVLAALAFLALGGFLFHLAWTSPDLRSVSPISTKPETPKPSIPTRQPSAPPLSTPPPASSPPEYNDEGCEFGFQYTLYPHNSPIRTSESQKQFEKHSIDLAEGRHRTDPIPDDTRQLDAMTSGPQDTSRGLSSMTSLSRLYASVLGKPGTEESPTPHQWVNSRNATTEEAPGESTQSSWRGQHLPPRQTYTA